MEITMSTDATSNRSANDDMVEIDPFEFGLRGRLVALDDGYNPDSGANWKEVSDELRALVIIATRTKQRIAIRGDPISVAKELSKQTLSTGWHILWLHRDVHWINSIMEHNLRVPRKKLDK